MKARRVPEPRDFQINVRLTAAELQMLRELNLVLGMNDSEVIRALIVKTHRNVEPAMVRAIQNRRFANEATRKKLLGE